MCYSLGPVVEYFADLVSFNRQPIERPIDRPKGFWMVWMDRTTVTESALLAGQDDRIKQGCRFALSALDNLNDRGAFLIRARKVQSRKNPQDWIKYDQYYLSVKSLSKRLFLKEKEVRSSEFINILSAQVEKIRNACTLYETNFAAMRPEDQKNYGELVFKIALFSQGLFNGLTIQGNLKEGALLQDIGFLKIEDGKIQIFSLSEPSKIAAGGHGTIFNIREVVRNQNFALKESKDDHELRNYGNALLKEAANLRKLPTDRGFQPAPILTIDTRKGKNGNVFMIGKLYMFPQLKSPDLHEWLHAPQEEQAKLEGFKQLWSQWLFLYENKIYHGDISAANVLVEPGCFSLGDFATAQFNLKKFAYTNVKGPSYAPEGHELGQLLSTNEAHQIRSALSHDIFAMGATLFFMLTKEHPYKLERSRILGDMQEEGRPTGALKRHLLMRYSDDCQNLLKEMLSFEIPKTDLELTEKVNRMKRWAERILKDNSLLCIK